MLSDQIIRLWCWTFFQNKTETRRHFHQTPHMWIALKCLLLLLGIFSINSSLCMWWMHLSRQNYVHPKWYLNQWIFVNAPSFFFYFYSNLLPVHKGREWERDYLHHLKQHISDLHKFFDTTLKVILSILIQSFINIKITFWIFFTPLLLLKACVSVLAFQTSDYHSCSNASGREQINSVG